MMTYNRTYYFLYDDAHGSTFHMTKLEEACEGLYDAKPEPRDRTDWERANLVGSMTEQDERLHLPMFDVDTGLYDASTIGSAFDSRVEMIQSRTCGHYHVYVDIPLDWTMCRLLLHHFDFLGVIDHKWAEACIRQEQMYLRKSTVR